MEQQINKRIILVKRPQGFPDETCFKIVESPIPAPEKGQVLIKTKYLSVDPYMRNRMNDVKSYIPPFQLNETLQGGAVGEVIETMSKNFSKGDFVTGFLPWQHYTAAEEKAVHKLDPRIAPVSTALGVLGLTGITAYFGLLEIGRPKPGETVVVSGAAGAVGMIVGQIAKIKGCRAVGTAGSDRKVKYLVDELGFDAAVNYKTAPDLGKALQAACPKGVDVYFDNVGGDISDAVMFLINDSARIPLCGQIALYNTVGIPTGPRIQPLLLIHHALVNGFLVSNYADRFEEATAQLAAWIKENKLKYAETIIEGLENTPRAFLGLFKGENLGKQLVKVG
ncbi:MAG: NADP-dependent oxidoreductase [Spirochaetes bacterium RBG_16_49_21]|nr:MAG: NADP-dependent oxidoreductase [Spirochaetes bacterium RBG_16_49_21]